jgi:sugar/nucleoside kinase (ribokinase family)
MRDFRISACDIAVLGAAAIDWVARVDELPRRDGITWANVCEPFPGGSGANMASAIAKLGKSVRFIGRLGDDEGGKILWEAFQQDGVDPIGIRIEKDKRSASCFIAVDSHGSREIYCLGGIALYDRPQDLSPAWFKDLKILIIADAYPEVALAAMALVGAQTLVVFTPGGLMAKLLDQELDPLLSKTSVLIVNRVEAEKIANCNDMNEAIHLLAERGPKIIIVTLGERGILLWDGNEVISLPAFKPKRIVDTTGAGDAFAAGFSVGMVERMDWISAARLGNAVSALKIGSFGARNGVPNLQQAIELIKRQESL